MILTGFDTRWPSTGADPPARPPVSCGRPDGHFAGGGADGDDVSDNTRGDDDDDDSVTFMTPPVNVNDRKSEREESNEDGELESKVEDKTQTEGDDYDGGDP